MLRHVVLATALLLSAGCIEEAAPTGSVEIHNADTTAHKLRVTDNADCQLGLNGELGPNTRSSYDVDLAAGAYICVGDKKPGVKVTNGGFYTIKGGALSKGPRPTE